MKFKCFLFCIMPSIIHASPIGVTTGGTGLSTLSNNGQILYSTSSVAMATLAIGSSEQVLTVSGSLPAWTTTAILPGYIAATGFAYAGSNSTVATSSFADRSMIISSNVPTGMTSLAVDNTIIGYNALNAVNSGTQNTAIGSSALAVSTGSGSTAIGAQSCASTTTGALNTAIGYESKNLNISGGNNTAIGYRAQQLTLGNENTSVGGNSFSACRGNYNTGTGCFSGSATVSNLGDANTCIGARTSSASTVATSNIVFIGSFAGINNRTSNTLGIGVQALMAANAGVNNTAIGNQVLSNNTSGVNNCAIGYQSLFSCVSGARNTACGSFALRPTTSSDSTAIGFNSLRNVSSNASGSRMTGLGSSAGSTATSGTNNIYLGYNAVPISTTESNNIVIGNSSALTAYMFGISGVTSAGATNVVINASGQLGTIVSSKRFKENIIEVSQEELQQLLSLKIVKFNYIGDETEEIHYGLIAEEVYEIMPEIVITNNDNQITSVQYSKLIPLLIAQVQADQSTIDDLKNEIEIMQKNIQDVLKKE